MQFLKVREGRVDVIEDEWSFRMTGKLDALPGCEIGEDLFASLGNLPLDAGNLFIKIDADRMGFAMLEQLLQFALQLCDWLLKIKLMLHGSQLSCRRWNQATMKSGGSACLPAPG